MSGRTAAAKRAASAHQAAVAAHQAARQAAWAQAWALTASAETCRTGSAATGWADAMLKAFDERFPPPSAPEAK